MPQLIGEQISRVLDLLADHFMFRKLGICYDLKALPEEFPRKSLPVAKEVKNNQPDARGRYTGICDCVLNNALLFDGCALRLEIGFSEEKNEVQVFDRLIGGAIRFSTIAPNNVLIGGLAPDGKTYYPDPGTAAYIAWAFYAWRIAATPTVIPESQGKIINIASRWIAHLAGDNFVLPCDNKELLEESWRSQPQLCGILAAAWAVTGEEKWKKLALEKAVFTAALPAQATAQDLLPTQLGLHIIAQVFPEEEAGKNAKMRMLEILPLALKLLPKATEFSPREYEKEPALDWHEIGKDGVLPPSWECYAHEESTFTEAINAALACLLTADAEALKPHADILKRCIDGVEWGKLRLARSLCPVLSVHARGVELGLWDEPLREFSVSFDGEEALVSRYLVEDFDEKNPEKSGHNAPPQKERPEYLQPEPEETEQEAAQPRGARKRRRRKRKK